MTRAEPLVVEIIGPAGSGKTTLLEALERRSPEVRAVAPLSKRAQLPFALASGLRLLPIALRHHRRGRWFSRREMRSMAYLEAWLHLLERSPEANTITIFDHGPIYRLTLLRELGPEIVHSAPYTRWWARLLRRWTEALDVAVWLDAPNRALLDRIRARERWHSVKDADDREADEFLERHRTVLEEAIATVGRDGQVTVLRFDSGEEPLEEIVDTVLAAFDSAREAHRMRSSHVLDLQ